jgi:Spy/CpxP family protein refolding chaperone
VDAVETEENTMKSSLKVATIVLVAAMAAAAPVAAQGYGRHGHRGPEGAGFVAHMTKALGLTDDQQIRVRTIVSNYRDGALGDSMHAMRKARANLRRTIHDLDATDKQVQEAVTAVATTESRLATEQHRMAIDIGGVLTADQRAKLAELKSAPGHDDDGPPPPPDGDL